MCSEIFRRLICGLFHLINVTSVLCCSMSIETTSLLIPAATAGKRGPSFNPFWWKQSSDGPRGFHNRLASNQQPGHPDRWPLITDRLISHLTCIANRDLRLKVRLCRSRLICVQRLFPVRLALILKAGK